MSADTTGTEVFAEIEPDPDAVLEAFGVDSTDDIDDDAGVHEPTTDDELDVDDTTAAELFADLQQVVTDQAEDAETSRTDESGTPDADDLEFEFIGDADVTVRADGAVVESSAAELSALTPRDADPVRDGDADPVDDGGSHAGSDTGDSSDEPTTSGGVSSTLTVRSEDELELVGPEPTPTRVTNDSFSHEEATLE